VQYLQRCDHIVVMDKASDNLLIRLSLSRLTSSLVSLCFSVCGQGRVVAAGSFEQLLQQRVPAVVAAHVASAESQESNTTEEGKPKVATVASKVAGVLHEKEDRNVGEVPIAAYSYYARSGGLLLVCFILLVMFGGRLAEVWSMFWLVDWSRASLQPGGLSRRETNSFVNGYVALSFAGVLGLTTRSFSMATLRLGASKNLHERLVESVTHSPFFFLFK